MMKLLITLEILWLMLPLNLTAQNPGTQAAANASQKSESIGAVPDLPAFNALGVQPSNLLRPADVKTLATDMSSFIQGGSFVIPQGFAIEVSPGALIYRDRIISVSDYKKQNVNLAYNTGISLGTTTATGGVRKIAIGVRTTFVNDADKFLNDAHRAEINALLESNSMGLSSWEKFKDDNKAQFKTKGDDLTTLTFTAARKTGDSTLEKGWENDNISKVRSLVKASDLKFEQDHWNARRIELAAAFVMIAADSLGKNIMPGTLNFWFTGAAPINKYGQFVGGIYAYAGFHGKQKDTLGNTIYPPLQVSGTGRFYAGVNKYKFLAEFQIGVEQDSSRSYYFTNHLSIGTELGIFNLAWVSLNGGIKDLGATLNNKSITTGFFKLDLKFSIPDWAKFRN